MRHFCIQRNGMRTAAGRTPANLDLFMKLDQEIDAIERERDVKIGFWHVSREHNTIADRLATAAALGAPPASLLHIPIPSYPTI